MQKLWWLGRGVDALRSEILANFIPFRVFQSATHENNAYPLLRNKLSEPDTLIYVCQNYSCRQPVATVEEMLAQLIGRNLKNYRSKYNNPVISAVYLVAETS